MLRLEDLALFVRAAALSSFSDAAREAGLQPAQVSAAIKRLETTLNIRLFARSTRSLRLTPEGEAWLPYATQMLDTLHAGLQKIRTPDDEVRGTLQIAVPSDLGRNLLLRVFRGFASVILRCVCGSCFPIIGPTCLKIRWTWPFATAITTMLRLSPCPSRPITDECWWLRPAG